MKTKEYLLISVLTVAVLVGGSLGIMAQDQTGKMKDSQMDMTMMMEEPNHKLMMAYIMSMSEFAKALDDQAVKPKAMDVEFARAAVAEIRHNFDAMEAARQKHMGTMSIEMKAKMKMMMEKMDKGQATTKEHVLELETAVRADHPDSKQVAMHVNALLKQLEMMLMMNAGNKAGKEMEMKK